MAVGLPKQSMGLDRIQIDAHISRYHRVGSAVCERLFSAPLHRDHQCEMQGENALATLPFQACYSCLRMHYATGSADYFCCLPSVKSDRRRTRHPKRRMRERERGRRSLFFRQRGEEGEINVGGGGTTSVRLGLGWRAARLKRQGKGFARSKAPRRTVPPGFLIV